MLGSSLAGQGTPLAPVGQGLPAVQVQPAAGAWVMVTSCQYGALFPQPPQVSRPGGLRDVNPLPGGAGDIRLSQLYGPGHQEARPTGAGPGSGTRLPEWGEGTGLLIPLPALREPKPPHCGGGRNTPERGRG